MSSNGSKLEIYGALKPGRTLGEKDMESKVKALQMEDLNYSSVSRISSQLLHWKTSIDSIQVQHKKQKGRRYTLSRDILNALDSKLNSYTLKLLKIFRNECSGCDEADYAVFQRLDSVSQQTYGTILPLIKILEGSEQNSLTVDEHPCGLAGNLELRFLEYLIQWKCPQLIRMLEFSWARARSNGYFVPDARNLNARVYRAQLNSMKPLDFCVEATYLENSTVYAKNLAVPPTTAFLSTLSDIILTEQSITQSFSMKTQENVRVNILKQTLYRSEVLTKLISSLMKNYRASPDVNKIDLKSLQELCKAAGCAESFMSGLVEGMYKTMEDAFSQRTGFADLQKLIHYDEEILCHLFEDASFKVGFERSWKTHCSTGSRAQIMATDLIKCLNTFFKQKSQDADLIDQQLEQFISRARKLFQLNGEIVPAFTRLCLLRRAVKEGRTFLTYLFEAGPPTPEMKVYNSLLSENLPGDSHLRSVKDSLEKSYLAHLHLNIESPDIGPVILTKRDVEMIYKPESVETLRLPEDMRPLWGTIEEKISTKINTSTCKTKLNLIPMLNTVELQTPFVLPNSRPLVIQVNLLQATVLLQFSQCDCLSFYELKKQCQLVDDELLTKTLRSLSRIGLLLQNRAQFTFNNRFQPKGVNRRNNTMRIDFHGSQPG
ncbi:LAME_0F18998g1_1 [Lachancea meyersii CBS 8951]|uniref:LAME_0F18998g1_1 n=1 Tax=Lachancea meyersii CBS 8951 TaxID=1266667 RepID=A0A1G4K183_9SACH|nr:LAME_0F18998g1_1 [Lachancea meyersii CBS 8951]